MSLPVVWYWIIGALFAGYAVLDGLDLGVGALHLLAPTDTERRAMLNSIGPVWDGNEVWLVVGGGALFAAFPPVYATVFSGFYLALILLLLALIFRAAAIEFRNRRPGHRWRQTWDVAFSLASVVATLLFGIALGNVIRGISINAVGDYTGSFGDLLNPYALLTAITTLALFVVQGAVYLVLRTAGDLQERAARWVKKGLIVLLVCFAALTLVTFAFLPHMAEHVRVRPWVGMVLLGTLAAMWLVRQEIEHTRSWRAFLSSSVAVVGMLLLAGISMFPVLVFAAVPGNSLTAFNASSSPKTLRIMLIVVMIGLPLAVSYTVFMYRVFRSKVKVDAASY